MQNAKLVGNSGGVMAKHWVLIFFSFLLFGGFAYAVDSDGDGLSDSVEASLGSSPLHKDIFVEIDWFIVNGRSMKPRPGFVEFVQSVFAAAPVLNPDGTAGIRIHLELSQGIRTNQTVLGYSLTDSSDTYQGINSIFTKVCISPLTSEVHTITACLSRTTVIKTVKRLLVLAFRGMAIISSPVPAILLFH
jgi:hypothetical protein